MYFNQGHVGGGVICRCSVLQSGAELRCSIFFNQGQVGGGIVYRYSVLQPGAGRERS